ncbi:MAG TPA: pyridoxamine 5'-phosphate oxidase family protein [Woeseiaceae bacterium]|nr:pyridoxamine 5'-phosphate oxidase family protein [Woeseiaceae bacterium]
MESRTSTTKKLDELYDLIDDMEIALMTTRRPDGALVTRPMATQESGTLADIWFVTSNETHKVDELRADPNVSLGYFDDGSKEWVSVSGTASLVQDREKIRELYQPDWKAYFEDEGGERDGGPGDPRLALICVDVHSVHYMKAKFSKPRTLFEIARGMVTGKAAELGREERLTEPQLEGRQRGKH